MAETDTETAVHIEPRSPGETTLSDVREVLSMALFDHGATAITQTPHGSLLAGFLDRRDADAAIAAIGDRYQQFVASIDIAIDANHDWSTSQRGGFTPTRVGPWLIRTPWAEPLENIDARFDIQIDPGEAFGHGAHPTTKLAMELMTPHLAPGAQVIDIGTGTGVLAIIAARSGARVRAIDNSPAAIAAARSNIAHNSTGQFVSLADQIELIHGDLCEIDLADAPLVVANLTIDVQSVLAPKLQQMPTLIASGVLAHQVGRLRDLYPSHWTRTTRSEGEWTAVELVTDPMPDRGGPRT